MLILSRIRKFLSFIFVLGSHFAHVALMKRPFCLKNVCSTRNVNEKNEIKLEQNIHVPAIRYTCTCKYKVQSSGYMYMYMYLIHELPLLVPRELACTYTKLLIILFVVATVPYSHFFAVFTEFLYPQNLIP